MGGRFKREGTYVYLWLIPYSSNGKESACNAGDQGSITGSGRSSGKGNGNPLQCSCLESPMDREAFGLQSVGSQSQTRLSD